MCPRADARVARLAFGLSVLRSPLADSSGVYLGGVSFGRHSYTADGRTIRTGTDIETREGVRTGHTDGSSLRTARARIEIAVFYFIFFRDRALRRN